MGESEAQRFQGKVALITGSASGIGRATALRIAREGGSVLCADVQAEGVEQSAKLARELGAEAEARICDVSDPAQVAASVAACIDRFGRLDALCNIAGILRFDHTHELALEDWNRILAVNLTGTFLMCQAALPHLLESNGAIVNTSSIRGVISYPDLSAYTASKHAVLGLTRAAALEYADKGIRINAVCPGVVKTALVAQSYARMPGFEERSLALHPVGRFGTAEEIAATVLWLCSDEASYVAGNGLVVDGGWVAQ